MKGLLIVALLTLHLFGPLRTFAQESGGYEQIVEDVMPAIVLVNSYDASGRNLKRGTGFCVTQDLFLTNYHVVENASRITIRTNDDRTYPVLPNSIMEKSDLALLKSASEVCARPLRLASAAPKPGEKIVVVGNPLGLTGTVSDGIVSAIRDSEDLVQITAPISPGSSGSPVLNLRGEVIGVATLNLKGGQNLNFAVSASHIRTIWPSTFTVSRVSSSPKVPLSSRWRLLNDKETTYDKQSLTRVGELISVWINYDNKDGTNSKQFYEINCSSRKIRMTQSISYGIGGKVEQSSSAPNEWAAIVPDSNGESYFEIFCKGHPDYQTERESDEIFGSAVDFEKSGNHGAAIEEYWKVIRISSRGKDASFALYMNYVLADANLESIYKKQKDLVGLEELYKFRISDGTLSAYYDLAAAYKEFRKQAKLLSVLQSAIRLFENRISSPKVVSSDFGTLADLYILQNQFSKAHVVLVKGRERFPSDTYLTIDLGEYYNSKKQWKECVELIERFMAVEDIKPHQRLFLLRVVRTAYEGLGDTKNVARVDRELNS